MTSSRHVAVRSPLPRTRARIASVPAWVWLGALVLASAAFRLALAKPHPAPWIFGDEIVYSNLAESFARTGSFAIRDSPGLHGYGPGYPLLIAPAYAVFDDLAHAYAAVKAINAVIMSLAAIPVYFIARRMVSVGPAFLASALALAIPSLIYTGTVMTENAFYPAFLACVLALLAAIERPTLWRQLGALAFVGVAFLIRAQAVTLIPAFVTAIVLVCLVESRAEGHLGRRDLARRLDAFRVTWVALVAGAILVLGLGLARGRSPSEVLGGYSVLADPDFSVSAFARWFVLHIAELDLYLGILPFAALTALTFEVFARGELPRALRIFGVLAVSLVVWMTLVVAKAAAFFSIQGTGRIEERNLFHLAPLFLVALVVWVDRGLPRIWPAAALAAVLAGGLPGAIPYNELANLSALSDTLVFIPLWNIVFFGHIQSGSLPVLVAVCSLAAAALYIVLPRRLALLPAVLVLGWFILVTVSLERQIGGTSSGVLQQGVSLRREWIDEAVGRDGQVAALWTGNPSPMTILENQFFNRSVHPVYDLDGAPSVNSLLPQRPATVDPKTGAVRTDDGRPVRADYALADTSTEVLGSVVGRDPIGTVLYKVDGDLRLRSRTSGIYPDGWTGPEAIYTKWRCVGGVLIVTVAGQPGLTTKPETVVVESGGKVVKRVRVAPDGTEQTLTVPLRARGGRCIGHLRVSPTVIPAQVLGTPDTRELGVRVTRLEFDTPS